MRSNSEKRRVRGGDAVETRDRVEQLLGELAEVLAGLRIPGGLEHAGEWREALGGRHVDLREAGAGVVFLA
jgi:hypothetical protein